VLKKVDESEQRRLGGFVPLPLILIFVVSHPLVSLAVRITDAFLTSSLPSSRVKRGRKETVASSVRTERERVITRVRGVIVNERGIQHERKGVKGKCDGIAKGAEGYLYGTVEGGKGSGYTGIRRAVRTPLQTSLRGTGNVSKRRRRERCGTHS
jgi:hypothetical protein